jgi:hypothetical protein
MSGDVSIGVMLTVERAFETGHPENTLLIQHRVQKETSIGEYIRPRAPAAPAETPFLHAYPAARVNSSAVARGAAVSHTHPQSPRLILVPRRRRAGVKRAPGPTGSPRAKGCSQQSTKKT